MVQFSTLSKKIFYGISLICGLLLTQTLNAQILLEYTFNEHVFFNTGVVNGEVNYLTETTTYPENSYFTTKIGDNSYTIKVYNLDYSLNINETYYFTPPSGYIVYSVFMSKKLFNSDDNYEFVVTYRKITSVSYDNTHYHCILYNQDGSIIKDFGAGSSITVYTMLPVIDNRIKLIVYRYLYDSSNSNLCKTEIYSVPGNPSGKASELKAIKSQSLPYPNPANSIITLPYQLKQGETSVMHIFDINGQQIETKQVDYVFDKILLNVSEYEKGVYIYEVNGVSSRFLVN